MNSSQVKELLLQSLEAELGGVSIYETAPQASVRNSRPSAAPNLRLRNKSTA